MSNSMHTNHLTSRFSLALLSLAITQGIAIAEETDDDAQILQLDTISVTASRVERATKEVPAAINVIDGERIEAEKMFNIKDAIHGTPGVLIESKNGGYDTRLIIRGAG